MDEVSLEKKKSLWQSVSFCLEVASAFYFGLLFQRENDSMGDLACADDLEDADMLLHEYTGYAIWCSEQTDEV